MDQNAWSQSIIGGIMVGREQKAERAKQEATEAKSLRTLMQVYDPEGKDQYTSMGLGELRGSAQAIAIKRQMEELDRQEKDRAAEQNFYGMLGSAPGDMGPVAPATGNRMLSAAAQTGYRLPPQVLTQMMREGEDGTDGFKFDPSQIVDLEKYGLPGQVYAPTSKGGGQIRTRFDTNSAGIEEVADEEGNVFKFMTNPKTGARTIVSRPTKAKTLPDSYNVGLQKLQSKVDEWDQYLTNDETLKTAKIHQDINEARKLAMQGRDRSKKALADHIARFKDQGYGDEAFWQSETQRLGLTESKAASNPTVTTKAQFDALPKGAIYTGKDGKQYRKP